MIISSLHKYIFVAVPKTGTHSIRQALREQMGPQDIEQVRLFVEKAFPIPELAQLKHGHISLAQLRPHLQATAFDGFFKFAFVRNPFDRFVSYCSFITRTNGAFARDPKAVMRQFLFTDPPLRHILFRPQHSFVTDEQGKLLTDYVGRVETMQQSYDEICDRIGIERKELGQANRSSHGDYRDYYDDDLKAGVVKLYGRDLELFGYEY